MSHVREDFDLANAYGQQGELWVADLIEHLRTGAGAVEVKRKGYLDSKFYIEVEKLSYNEWVPSGLSVTRASLMVFVIGDSGCAAVLSVDRLREVTDKKKARGYRLMEAPSATQKTRGYLLEWREILDAQAEENGLAA